MPTGFIVCVTNWPFLFSPNPNKGNSTVQFETHWIPTEYQQANQRSGTKWNTKMSVMGCDAFHVMGANKYHHVKSCYWSRSSTIACLVSYALPKMSARPKSHRAHSGHKAILAIHYKFGRIWSLWLSAYFSFFLGQDAAFAVIHFRWNMAMCTINAQHSSAVMDSGCRILVCPAWPGLARPCRILEFMQETDNFSAFTSECIWYVKKLR